MARAYIPEQGDIVWIDFSPQMGQEQAVHRPAIVISPSAYNRRIGLMICSPLTARVKGYPFEVEISGEQKAVVLADQVRTFDWNARNIKFKQKATAAELPNLRAVHAVVTGLQRDPLPKCQGDAGAILSGCRSPRSAC